MATTPRELSAMFAVVSSREQRGQDRWAASQAAFFNANFEHPRGKKTRWTPQDFGAAKQEITPEQAKAIQLASLVASRMAFNQHDTKSLVKWARPLRDLKPKRERRKRNA